MNNSGKFKILEHPSDIGIRFSSRTVEHLFEVAAEGMFSVMTDIADVKAIKVKNIKILKNPEFEIDDMLLAWLEELLFLYEKKMMIFSKFEVLKIIAKDYGQNLRPGFKKVDQRSLIEARAYGEKIDLKKHDISLSIKAPTYHQLEINKNRISGIWEGQVIFDV
jgi:SHS2 domain-containing protein